MKRIPTGRRFIFAKMPTTIAQRAKMKSQKIAEAREMLKEAQSFVPPLEITVEKEVMPDDPLYKTAPMGEDLIISE